MNMQYLCLEISCGPPPQVENANITTENPLHTYRSSVSYECRSGYQYVSGDDTKTCAASGQWDGTDIKCTGKHYWIFQFTFQLQMKRDS